MQLFSEADARFAIIKHNSGDKTAFRGILELAKSSEISGSNCGGSLDFNPDS